MATPGSTDQQSNISIDDSAERKALLDALVAKASADPTHQTWRIRWRKELESFPVVKVPSAWLRLNILSGRTHAAQSRADDPEVFEDHRSARAQDAQATLIRSLNNGLANSRLRDDLKDR